MSRLHEALAALFAASLCVAPASAKEFYVGEPVVKNEMQIVPHYLLGIEMSTAMPKGIALYAHEPDAASAWLRDPTLAPHGGESIAAVIRRVGQWLADQYTRHQRTIVVTHPAIIRAAIVHAIEAAPQSFWRIDIAPLSVTRLSGLSGRWNLSAAGCPAPQHS
jgi:Histidine phosphatase superfamily (branch 1)